MFCKRKVSKTEVISTEINVSNFEICQKDIFGSICFHSHSKFDEDWTYSLEVLTLSSKKPPMTQNMFREHSIHSTPLPVKAPVLNSLVIERFHMTSLRPYWCSKTKKRRPYWCTKPSHRELKSIFIQKPSIF